MEVAYHEKNIHTTTGRSKIYSNCAFYEDSQELYFSYKYVINPKTIPSVKIVSSPQPTCYLKLIRPALHAQGHIITTVTITEVAV